MKLTHIQVFLKEKECMKLEYFFFVFEQIPCSFFWCFVCSDIHNKIYTNEYLSRDIVVYF